MSKTKPIRIMSMGKYLPLSISSEVLEKEYGLPKGWSEKYSGVISRHKATTEHNGFMGARAAEEALEKGNMTLADIDLLISASGTYDYPLPNQASVIKAEMKDGNKYHFAAIDIDSTCLSFVAALEFATGILDGKRYKNILIVSSEISSKGLNPDNWETLTLFGDGAVAAVVSYQEYSDSKYIMGGQRTYSEGVYHTIIEGGGNRYFFKENPYNKELHSFKMNGKQLLKLARIKVPEFIDWFFKDLENTIDTVDAIIPHQASKAGISILRKLYKIDDEIVKETLHKYGNCIAASIPLTLMDAIDSGEVKRGDVCLLIGTSAGFSIGAALIKY